MTGEVTAGVDPRIVPRESQAKIGVRSPTQMNRSNNLQAHRTFASGSAGATFAEPELARSAIPQNGRSRAFFRDHFHEQQPTAMTEDDAASALGWDVADVMLFERGRRSIGLEDARRTRATDRNECPVVAALAGRLESAKPSMNVLREQGCQHEHGDDADREDPECVRLSPIEHQDRPRRSCRAVRRRSLAPSRRSKWSSCVTGHSALQAWHTHVRTTALPLMTC